MSRLPILSVLAASGLAMAAAGVQAAPQTTAPAARPAPSATPTPQPTATSSAGVAGSANTAAGANTATGTPVPAARAASSAGVEVGGAMMLPTATITDNLAKATNLSTLVQAIGAADLTATLSGPGPFTFAPSNDAFGRLAPGTLHTLMKPENKATLVKLLKYHVVPGKLDGEALKAQITAGGGTAKLSTLAGDQLTATLENNAIVLSDVNGNKSYVVQYDVPQSNGIVHVVNGVVIPSLGS